MNATTPLRLALACAVLTLSSLAARADVAEQWMSIARETIRASPRPAAVAQANLASVRDALDAVARSGNGHTNGNGNGHSDGLSKAASERKDAGVAVAAFAVLESLYPEQREELESRLAVTFSRIPETDAKAEGAVLGRRIAGEILGAGR
jgi:hypothetical protein